MNGNKSKLLHKLQEDKPTDSAREAFKRKPYETLAEYAKRKWNEECAEDMKTLEDSAWKRARLTKRKKNI